MIKSYFLKCRGKGSFPLAKQFVTVGEGAGFDIGFESSKDRILFTLERTELGYKLIPGQARVMVNGKRLSESRLLKDCDRIEFDGKQAILFENEAGTLKGQFSSSEEGLEILESLVKGLGDNQPLDGLLTEALSSIAKMAGAEEAYLISEIDLESRTEWKLLARYGNTKSQLNRKDLISSTIVNEAIKSAQPMYIESLIGHPMATQASLMGVRLFSIACFPLKIGDYPFGVVYLSTSTPGKSIRKEVLKELSIVATQVALLLACRSELNRIQRENDQLRDGDKATGGSPLVYTSNVVRELMTRVHKLAASDLNLLVMGETGTGKELIAREIHQRSPRALGPFVVVNCAAIPPTLVESVLFGHTKGAYTGASQNRPGKFVQAHGGTIFLDEIGELPLDVQVRLLRVLQERQIEAIGSDEPVNVDFRVVAATHRDLTAAVASKTFREDLFFRLNGATLRVPPLRDRGEQELTLLAEHFLKQNAPYLTLSDSAKEKLKQHSWPGNVRELEQVVSRGIALASHSTIEAADLELSATAESKWVSPAPVLTEGKRPLLKEMAERALANAKGDRSLAAKALGISERTLYRWLG